MINPPVLVFLLSTRKALLANVFGYIAILSYLLLTGTFQKESSHREFMIHFMSAYAIMIVLAQSYAAYARHYRRLTDFLSWRNPQTGQYNENALKEYLKYLYRDKGAAQKNYRLLYFRVSDFHKVARTFSASQEDDLQSIMSEAVSDNVPAASFVANSSGQTYVVVVLRVGSLRAGKILVAIMKQVKDGIREQNIGTGLKYRLAVSGPSSDFTSPEDFYESLETAIKQIKHKSRQQLSMYTPALRQATVRSDQIIERLHQKDWRHFSLVFQPQVDTNAAKLIGAEVLVRWNDPDLGFVSPAQFIPLAEKQGVIHDLSLWIYDRALATLAELNQEGLAIAHLSLNLSPAEFGRISLRRELETAIRKHGVPASQVLLEITETSYFANPFSALRIVNSIKNDGFQFAIDDFGTGYSGISYLKDFPVDYLKIDRDYVKALSTERQSQVLPILEATKLLADRKGMEVIVEGVEDENEVAGLEVLGFRIFQGYHFYKPLTLDQLKEALRKGYSPS